MPRMGSAAVDSVVRVCEGGFGGDSKRLRGLWELKAVIGGFSPSWTVLKLPLGVGSGIEKRVYRGRFCVGHGSDRCPGIFASRSVNPMASWNVYARRGLYLLSTAPCRATVRGCSSALSFNCLWWRPCSCGRGSITLKAKVRGQRHSLIWLSVGNF